ncbi:Zinc finger and BTB domain-containing protein [Fasciola hepatica]|uniref:Zinc finger and BTB domain-containing protein n=1 Tax=Fasciola hepatica TaxID=6192 RepID=A0A4E0RYP3_FASHE|nr:Zinc finger and BTB domain-containing protein [Fasciola hepatica]
MEVYFTLVKKLNKYTWSIQKYKMNDAQGTGQTFADACDEGTEIDTEQYDLSGFTGATTAQTTKSSADEPNFRVLTCAFCNKVFTKNCNLNAHIKTVHKGVKPFECRLCYKGFTRNSDLHKHIDAVHKGLKPFGCEMCQRSFSQKSSLKRHIEAIHEV